MIQYFDDYDLACIDGHSFRRDKKTGYYLSSKKIDGKRKRLHVYVWEKHNGKVPKGMSVHHVDGDKTNNDISNFALLTNEEHTRLHGSKLDVQVRKRRAEAVVENAMPKAKAWHSSDEGKAWHSKHGSETMANAKEHEYKCTQCGQLFTSRHAYGANQNRFCSGKCKTAHRRAAGSDNVVKICEKCGGEYTANKYQNTKYCDKCRK